MKQLSIHLYYHLIGEFIVAYLLFIPIFILNHVENEGIYFIIAFISSMIVMRILSLQSTINLSIMIGVFFIGTVVGVIFQLSIVPLTLLLAYSLYRVRAILLNGMNDSSRKLLLYTFGVAILVLMINVLLAIDSTKDVPLLVSILVSIQLVYCLIIGHGKNLILNGKKIIDRHYLLPLVQLVTILTVTIGGLYLLRDFFLRSFFFAIQGFIAGLKWLLTPLLKLLDIELPPMDKEPITPVDIPEVNEAEVIERADSSFITFIIIGFMVIATIILLIVLYKLLKRKSTAFSYETELPTFEQTTKDLIGGLTRFSNKGKEPTNKIRKEIYALEKFAYKKGIGRNKGETVRQWFDRLQIAMSIEFFDNYEQVRYGEQVISHSIQEKFINEAKLAKQQMQKTIKERKDK